MIDQHIRLSGYFFILLIFFLHAEISFAQYGSASFSQLSVKDGLAQSAVHEIIGDQYGYIWFGTRSGLSQYDGKKFVNFFKDTSDSSTLSANYILELKETTNSDIWVGTSSGLNKYDRSEGNFIRIRPDQLENKAVFDVFERDAQTLMLATSKGIFLYNTVSDSIYRSSAFNFFDSLIVKSILPDGDGYLIASRDGLFAEDNESIRTVLQTDVNDLYRDQNGKIWVAADLGVYTIAPGKKRPERVEKSEASGTYGKIQQDSNGNLVVGNLTLEVYTPSGSLLYLENKLLSNPGILSVYCAPNGALWIGTNGTGVYVLDPNLPAISLVRNDNEINIPISSNYISSMYSRDDNVIFIGAGPGLNRYNRTTGEVTLMANENIDNMHAVGNILWVACSGKLLKFDLSTYQLLKTFNVPEIGRTRFINTNSESYLLIGTGGGLLRMDMKTGEYRNIFPTSQTALKANLDWVTGVYEQADHYLVSTGEGLYQLDKDSYRSTKITSSSNPLSQLQNSHVKCMREDRSGKVNIGTWGDGFFRWDPKDNTLKQYTRSNGLPDDVIYGILEDEKGNLWLSSNYGLSRFSPDNETFFNLDVSYGLQSNEFNTSAYFQSTGGTLYFGGVEGLNFFKPEGIENTIAPDTYISGITMQNETKTVFELTGEDQSIYELDRLELDYDQNMLGFEFFGNNLTLASQNQFAYYLEGLEEDWNYVGNRSFASYPSIPPGEYTFKVMSSNNNRLWDPSPKELVIIINPPYWETRWFRLSLLALVAGLVFLGVRFRLRNIKQQKAQLEDMVKNRTSDLKNIIQVIKENSHQLSNSGEDLKTKSGMLATEAQTQASTARLIESDVLNVTEHTRRTRQNAMESDKIGESTVSQLEQINEATQKNIEVIGEINEKVTVLEEIFRQTNILSLNASIEAARAGAAGGGFAVIAAEIRKLAQKSYFASKEIGESTSKGTHYTQRVGELIMDFLPEVQKSAELIKEISNSTTEQNNYIENINESLAGFFNTSRKNSSISNEIYIVSSELDELAKYLNEQVMKIKI